VLNIVLVLSGVVLAAGLNYITNGGPSIIAIPAAVKLWAVPISAISLVVGLGAQIWLHVVEHPRQRVRWPSDRSPFPGLEAFTEEEAGVFFARERETQELTDRLTPVLPSAAHRFVAMIGPSGVGKSSVLYAGLLPRLRKRAGQWTIVPPIVPEAQPTRNLIRALGNVLPGLDEDTAYREFTSDPQELAKLTQLIRKGYSLRPKSALIVIDQAEELVTLCGETEAGAFLNMLDRALDADPRLWIVCALRSDFITAFLDRGFSRLFHSPLMIGALDRQQLFDVVEKPAEIAGLAFAPGVVGRLVDDTESGDALPLLACTLQVLYETVGTGRTVTEADYERAGGVAGTLARQGDKVLAELEPDYPDGAATDVLTKFVAIDNGQPVRRRVAPDSLSPAEMAVVNAFIAARLLHLVGDGDDRRLEVVHEAIFRQWAPLREKINARSDELRQRAELERVAEDWNDSGRSSSYLLRGDRLRRALEWAAREGDISAEYPVVHELLQTSASSDDQARKQLSEAIARQALSAIDRDPEYSTLLVLAAVEECGPTPVAHRALLASLAALRTKTILRAHQDAVRAVSWSADGRRVASCSHDQTVRVWSPDGTPLRCITGHADWVRAVQWAPDSRRLATASSDATARVWDADTGQQVAVMTGHRDVVQAVAWAPSGSRIATASHDGTARVWDAGSGDELLILAHPETWVRGVAWSPDERWIVTGSSDGRVLLWDARSGDQGQLVGAHDDWVHCVCWAPHDALIASASSDESVRVWAVAEGGDPVLVLHGHSDWVHQVAWSPDGASLATASRDRTIRTWNGTTGAEISVLRGHSNWVHGLTWSADGSMIASASYDKTVRIWEAQAATTERVLRHDARVQGVAWSPDSSRLATASHDFTAKVWNVTGDHLATLSGHTGWVHDITWSPPGRGRLATSSRDLTALVWDENGYQSVGVLRGHDNWVEALRWSVEGARIATGSNDRTARIWDASTLECMVILRGHTGWVRAVAWSPSGERLATASTDGTARIWQVATGDLLHVLSGHEDSIEDVAWDCAGLQIATACNDRTARIWSADDGSLATVLSGHDDWVTGVCWSPDGNLLATSSSDRTARIWDVSSGSEIAVLSVQDASIEAISWSSDGQWIATASRDGSARIINAVPQFDTLVTQARSRVFRSLTPEERKGAMLPDATTAE